jgi:osmotically-inducible protein OsmY
VACISEVRWIDTLIGRVSSQAIKDTAERLARATKGVKDVNNELVVGKIKP